MWNILFKSACTAGLLAICNPLVAQTYDSYTPKKVDKKVKPIRSEFSVGLRLNTDGWGIFATKGYVRSKETKLRDQFYNVMLFQLEFSEHKDPKEVKRQLSEATSGGGVTKTQSFIYGKINNFYSLKIGFGTQKLLAGKPDPGAVSIHWVATGGFALGMEKPYYLDGYVLQDNATLVHENFKYSDGTKSSFLDERYINGSAGFSKGLSEIQFIPGIHANTGVHFDFAANRKTVLAVETGISAEYYTQAIQIMANQEAKPYLVNLYASFQFGRRK